MHDILAYKVLVAYLGMVYGSRNSIHAVAAVGMLSNHSSSKLPCSLFSVSRFFLALFFPYPSYVCISLVKIIRIWDVSKFPGVQVKRRMR